MFVPFFKFNVLDLISSVPDESWIILVPPEWFKNTVLKNVDTPELLNCVENKVLCWVVMPTKVETPVTFKVWVSVLPKIVTPTPVVDIFFTLS